MLLSLSSNYSDEEYRGIKVIKLYEPVHAISNNLTFWQV